MSVIKNEIPLLEYDDDPAAVIMPGHQGLALQLPQKVVFAFLGECVDHYAAEQQAPILAEFVSITKKYPIYLVRHKGQQIGLCQAPMGSAAAVQILDWLIGYGAKTILSAGSCGALVDLPENTFLIPAKALRDEGASYHYLPPARFVVLDEAVVQSMEATLNDLELPYTRCTTWSTDGFFRETKEKIRYRAAEGCTVVEMECAALAACAEFRGVRFGQLLFTADSLANLEAYDERGWGEDSMEKALLLCLDMIADLG